MCVCHGSSHSLRPRLGDRVHEEGAGGDLQEGRVARARRLQAERGERDGRHRGGRRQGGHLPGRGGDARRHARPGKPRPRQDQEGVLGQRQRLPRPSRVLPRAGREAHQGARQVNSICCSFAA
uniref:Universal stress protein family protein, expressed n=1 Tax=Oryza sativa subsp. japonica TaxID=39947 RepID=Q10CT7_ORYSJ|nr:universal stress protein family protein, expressed [Oryza sativa Japonica Group]BAG92431.1 unnamed protein product [Oryza sativa Japonica Group]